MRDIPEQKDPLPGFLRYNPEAYITCREASLSNRLPEQWSDGVAVGGGTVHVSEAISQNPPYLCMVCSKQTRRPWLQEGHGRTDGQVEPRNLGSGKKDMVMSQDSGVQFLRLTRRESLSRNRGGPGTQSSSSRAVFLNFPNASTH